MFLSPRPPSSTERFHRLVRLKLVSALVPLVNMGGRGPARRWLDRSLRVRADATTCFFVPLPLAEIALGSLPSRSCSVGSINTIMAEWVDCDGRMLNCLDYFLGSGVWGPLVRSTDGDPVREEARQILAADLDYKRTEVYQVLVEATRVDPPQRRQGRQLKVAADVDSYFERFVRLFRSILRHGILTTDGVERAGVRFNRDRGMGIAIDMDGSLHRLQGGNHRWAIAQVLGLAEVPVEIRLVHIACGMEPAEFLDMAH